MGSQLRVHYDDVGDILYFETCPPHGEQETEELDWMVLARRNTKTEEVEAVEIIGFSRRVRANELQKLPEYLSLLAAT